MAKRARQKKQSPNVIPAARPHTGKTSSLKNWVPLLQTAVIIAVVLWIYQPVMHGDWIRDDRPLVLDNTLIHDPMGLLKIWFEPDNLVDYFPLKVSVEWLEWQLWQNDTFGYHLVNIMLHILSALLVWRLLSKLGLRLAWLGGLLFAVHPVTVESVAWISELKNTLSLPPFLLAMIFYIDYDERGNRKDYFLALGFFLVAMLCKTTMVMFPVVILLYVWWKRNRIEWSDLKTNAPFFAISLALGLITIWFLHHHAIAKSGIAMGGFLSHLALAGLSITFYFSQCFWPATLLPIYPKWVIDPPSPVQFLPWLVLGTVIGWLWTKRTDWGRHALLGFGFFLITLAPFIGFTTGSYMDFTWVMDHLLYIPMIGLIGLVAAGLGHLREQLSRPARAFGIAIMTVAMALLAWESRSYAGIFVNEETLWTYTTDHSSQAWLAQNNLGKILYDERQIYPAIEHYQQALKIKPDYVLAHNNLGTAFFQLHQFPEAIEQFQEAIAINPNDALGHNNLGSALGQQGRIPEAIDQYQQAVKISPDYAEARDNLGLVLIQANRIPEAIDQYEEALKLYPNYANPHRDLGQAFLHTDRIPEAIEQFEQEIRLDPANADAYTNLADALYRANRVSESIDSYEQALKLNPNNAETHNNLGCAFLLLHKIPEAVDQFQQALKIKPDYADARKNLNLAQLQSNSPAAPKN